MKTKFDLWELKKKENKYLDRCKILFLCSKFIKFINFNKISNDYD